MTQPAAFFQKPGPQQLKRVQDNLARDFPLPIEAVERITDEEITELITQVNLLGSSADIVQLARHLQPAALDLLFPALILAGMDEMSRPSRTIDKILLILRERACPSLYPKAWIIFQRHYPHPQVTRALAILCGIVEIKRSAAGAAKPAVATALRSATGDQSARPKAAQLPLITNLIDLSGQSHGRKLVARLAGQPMTMSEFFERYAVNPDWPFGQAILFATFSTGTASQFSDQIARLDGIFSKADRKGQIQILKHFLTLTNLPPDIRQQAHVIFYTQIGAPGSPSEIWNDLAERERKVFSSWAGRARIGSHCLATPNKASFYLRYADRIQRVEQWDAETILIHFGRFVIADDRRFPEQALFYAEAVPSPHPAGLAEPDRRLSPGHPAIAHKQVAEILQQGEVRGIVQLYFDDEGIKQAGVLLDFALQSASGPSLFKLPRRR